MSNLKFKEVFDTGVDKALKLDTTLSQEGKAADSKAVGDALSEHNTSVLSHNDIRIALQDLIDQVTSLLNTDDQTLDETREIVAYIKANRTLIDNVTIEKVNVSDIVNNLVSNVTNRPLSAAQGVVLKSLIDANTAALAEKLNNSQLASAINTALAQAKESGEFNGEKGDPGKNGERGTGILKVTTAPSSYTTAIGNYTPKYRIALSTLKTQSSVDNVLIGDIIQYSYYQYKIDYLDSSYAYISATRLSIRGATGEAGTTPVKGTDYWTPDDQESIVQQVITALGTPVFGTVDENNIITLTGALGEGEYTFVYEDAEGNQTTLGKVTNAAAPKYTNVIPTSIGYDGNVFNGVGYYDGRKITSDRGSDNNLCYTNAEEGYFATGFFPYTIEQAINCVPFYVKGVNLDTLTDKMRIMLFGSEKDTGYVEPCKLTNSATNGVTVTKLADSYYKITPKQNFYGTGGTGSEGWAGRNAKFARFGLKGSGAGVIITVNEPIE